MWPFQLNGRFFHLELQLVRLPRSSAHLHRFVLRAEDGWTDRKANTPGPHGYLRHCVLLLRIFRSLNIGEAQVRPDGAPIELPDITVSRDGERMRFLPSGKSLVYMQGPNPIQDFWILDMATKTTRRLAHLTENATMRTFDITPNGKQIVFDRLRENSDIVLIDLPK